MDSTVMELDYDTGVYHLVYLADQDFPHYGQATVSRTPSAILRKRQFILKTVRRY